ncbi:DUF2784 domain-containing protein [Rhodocaloribacter litoris]|uniref:DUF2784 domain-containing protein n=1 Tax=Rhodocaloribacter litoris TaxID=2558931 RepID=UPI001420EDA6|nr:DUF2784 domain-containing protein [Rhodocaloribacter litoris]QXD15528.1 DUF2784 domain-containing protein [Rhodocaloribacter litoris]GIV58371.1 MAG: hypothetical protein KatS3mg042_1284 [Rhodothermaceae bacterium]
MLYRLLADVVVVVHFAFVLFVVLGGLLVLWRFRLVWVHVPAALWGAWVELAGWVCPLTPLENTLRRKGGEAGYAGGFVEEYVLPVLYPQGLTREVQVVLGLLVLGFNAVVYGLVFLRRRGRRAGREAEIELED